MIIEIRVNVFGTYDIWDKNELVCHSLKKEEVGEALDKWLCISKSHKKVSHSDNKTD